MEQEIQFKWEDCVAKNGDVFKFSKIRFEDVDFGVSLGKTTFETKEKEKFFLRVYRSTPLSPDYPDYWDSVWSEFDISANSFNEAMEYVENKRETIRLAMCANIERIIMFDKVREAMEEFIKKQKGNGNDKANMRL